MTLAGCKDIDTAAERLQKAVHDFYKKDTEWDAAKWGEETLPDFRDYAGVRLLKFGILLDPRCMCSSCTRHYAREIVDKLLIFEHGLIQGAAGSGDGDGIKRYFLEGQKFPSVFPRVPAHSREQADEREAQELRIRHVFGTQSPF
jgi:hypothetical protein